MKSTKAGKKPANLIYGLEERPPFLIAVPVVLQQVVMLCVDLIFPVLIVQAIAGPPQLAQSFVSLTMLAMGAGTILQGIRKGSVGSGYFCAQETGAIYFPASVLAAQTGGFSLLFGMTAAAGLLEVIIAKIIHRFRALFPAELAGLVVVMIGISLIPSGVSMLIGNHGHSSGLDSLSLITGLITLAVMVGTNVWGKGLIRQYSILVGIMAGYLLAYGLGILTGGHLAQVSTAPLVALPDFTHIGWSFDIKLVLPFLVAVLCSALKTLGNVTVCQKANDADWRRLDIKSAQGGLMADGLSTLLAGLIGGMGQNSSSGSIGLSIATGVTSRWLCIIVGGAFLVLAFFPKMAATVAIMPKPVMGAALTMVISFIVITGFQIILSRMLDARKTFMIGLALVFGLSTDMLPGQYHSVPGVLQPLFNSSFSLATITAIVLNMLFRIGVTQRQNIAIRPGLDSADTIYDFMERAGAAWGARREVVQRAIAALNEFMESAATLGLTDKEIKVTARFDEYNLDLDLEYEGMAMEFPTVRPSAGELLEDDKAFVRLSGFIVRQFVDAIKTETNQTYCQIHLHFEH